MLGREQRRFRLTYRLRFRHLPTLARTAWANRRQDSWEILTQSNVCVCVCVCVEGGGFVLCQRSGPCQIDLSEWRLAQFRLIVSDSLAYHDGGSDETTMHVEKRPGLIA